MKIHAYKSYRTLLKDYYERRKAEPGGFTYAQFARKAGLRSPNYLKLVMDGERILTTANIQAFGRALGLDHAELGCFEALVLENQAETPLEKKYYARRLAELRRASVMQVARRSPGELLESALRVGVLLCSSRRSEPAAIDLAGCELGLRPEEARRAIGALIEAGELERMEDGTLRLPAKHTMMSDPAGLSERQRRFLGQGLDEAGRVFRARYPKGAAKFLSLLLSAPEGCLPDLFEDARTALEQAVQKHEPEPGQAIGVYRLQLQAYRVGRDGE